MTSNDLCMTFDPYPWTSYIKGCSTIVVTKFGIHGSTFVREVAFLNIFSNTNVTLDLDCVLEGTRGMLAEVTFDLLAKFDDLWPLFCQRKSIFTKPLMIGTGVCAIAQKRKKSRFLGSIAHLLINREISRFYQKHYFSMLILIKVHQNSLFLSIECYFT